MAHCSGCGRASADHRPCGREDGPRRFCEACGRRLVDFWTPGFRQARCRDCDAGRPGPIAQDHPPRPVP